MGIQYLVRERRDPTTVIHAAKDRRGRDYHGALPRCIGTVQAVVHPELGVAVFHGPKAVVRWHCDSSGHRAECAVLGFLLYLLYQGDEGQEILFACVNGELRELLWLQTWLRTKTGRREHLKSVLKSKADCRGAQDLRREKGRSMLPSGVKWENHR